MKTTSFQYTIVNKTLTLTTLKNNNKIIEIMLLGRVCFNYKLVHLRGNRSNNLCRHWQIQNFPT